MNVLVVDDNAPIALLIAATLRGIATRIEVAVTFAAAKEWLQRDRFDLVLLDIGLPDSFPESTLDRLDELKSSSTKVVIVTGMWPPNTKLTPETIAVDGVLFKGDALFREKLQALVSGRPVSVP